jgi:hypothetical protein
MPAEQDRADRPHRLFNLAKRIAAKQDDFHVVRGPGAGDKATIGFMRELQRRALALFDGENYSEKRICGSNSFAVDFYFPEEGTIVEVALGLPNPASEFEKDVLKAIMAKESGHVVERLLFISRPGASRKCSQPGRTAISEWALKKHDIRIEIRDLDGEPRRRPKRARVV